MWLSGLFFFYVNALMNLGARKHLEQQDLWDVAPQHRTSYIYERFERTLRATTNPKRFPHVRIVWLMFIISWMMFAKSSILI
jgi:hypothetical protein